MARRNTARTRLNDAQRPATVEQLISFSETGEFWKLIVILQLPCRARAELKASNKSAERTVKQQTVG